MKLGMNLLLWTGAMNDGMLPVLESLKKMGYDGVELPMFADSLDVAHWQKWGKRLDDAHRRLARQRRVPHAAGRYFARVAAPQLFGLR